MIMLTLKIVIFLMSICMSYQEQKYTTEEEQHCGQYGFRCVDAESFQICTYPDSDGITDAPEVIHKCNDCNSVCDEDNLAYCTPLDPIVNDIKEKTKENAQKILLAKRGQYQKFSRNTKDSTCPNKPKQNEQIFKKRDSNKNVKSRNTYDLDGADDETQTTTIPENENDSSFQNQLFDCEHYGFYPDNANASMFWFCDYQNSGRGFTVRHMLCSPGRVFHPVHKECVLIGTTRDTRNERIHHSFTEELDFGVKFSCKNHIPGKYPDKINCRLYHYCFPLTFAPFNQLTFMCPDELTYDDERKTCNSLSSHRCTERDIKRNGQVHIEIGAIGAILLQKGKCKRDLRRHDPKDCSSYHLCYNNEVVHLKCPNSYNFDENLLICQPQQLVSCYGT